MPQTIYTKPYSWETGQVILTVLGCMALIATIVYGFNDKAITHPLWLCLWTLQIMDFLLDPDTCRIRRTKTNPDGSTIKIRRPLIGFKRCETLVDEDCQSDGYRYEKAYLRI